MMPADFEGPRPAGLAALRGVLVVAGTLMATPTAAQTPLVLDGQVAEGEPDHVLLPFEVPAGTVEIEVSHDDLSTENILDWGLNDPNGFRGWGGGNEEPAIVGESAASRSYVPGPIPAGTWYVVVGKAKISQPPASYHIEILLRDTPTLAAQPERQPYQPAAPLASGPRWYAGDFHVHSRESGDASATLDDDAALAASRGLDFIELTDHNVMTGQDFFADVQSRHPEVLLIPGVEYTTYDGHLNGIGATSWVDHKIGQPDVTIEGAAQAFAQQGALLSINHPALDVGDLCIGCAWRHQLPPETFAAVEVGSGGWKEACFLFGIQTIEFWDALCDAGGHAAAIGGSDDHKAGMDLGFFQSPIGSPTTMVYAEELSAAAILAGIAAGRTVVKLQGPEDPMVELHASQPPAGDLVVAEGSVSLTARITGGAGQIFRFVRDGVPLEEVALTSDDEEQTVAVEIPEAGQTRYRAEVIVEGNPRTLTSHLWFEAAPDPPVDRVDPENGASDGCGCRLASHPRGSALWLTVAVGGLIAWRRRRRGP
ncbi:MAG: CehA/McbA family metallohydrolase [Myxococcales bacterium]|nr:CehA/McbA family metallohydrolase [Myxococcales bacterium]